MAGNLDETATRSILSSFEEVGKTKAVGYLPTSTIITVLKLDMRSLCEKFISNGLAVKIFAREETCIKSGSIFVYDPEMVRCIGNQHHKILAKMQIANEPGELIDLISNRWFDDNHQIMPFIRALYNDVN